MGSSRAAGSPSSWPSEAGTGVTEGGAAHDRRSRRTWAWLTAAAAGVACAAAGLGFILFAPLPGESGDVVARSQGRGIIDYRLEQASVDPGAVPGLVAEMGPDALRASWTRVLVHWNALQPAAPDPAAEDPLRRGVRDAARHHRRRVPRGRHHAHPHHGGRAGVGQRPGGVEDAAAELPQGRLPALLRPGHGRSGGPGRLQGRGRRSSRHVTRAR